MQGAELFGALGRLADMAFFVAVAAALAVSVLMFMVMLVLAAAFAVLVLMLMVVFAGAVILDRKSVV